MLLLVVYYLILYLFLLLLFLLYGLVLLFIGLCFMIGLRVNRIGLLGICLFCWIGLCRNLLFLLFRMLRRLSRYGFSLDLWIIFSLASRRKRLICLLYVVGGVFLCGSCEGWEYSCFQIYHMKGWSFYEGWSEWYLWNAKFADTSYYWSKSKENILFMPKQYLNFSW